MDWVELYNKFIQAVLAPGGAKTLALAAGNYVKASTEGPSLDIGCGFNSPLFLTKNRLIGVDIDHDRAKAHSKRSSAIVADAAALPFASDDLMAVVSIGLLHHLSDADARSAIQEMVRVVRPDGVIAIFDGIKPDVWFKRPVAALIRALDVGHHMRDAKSLMALFENDRRWNSKRCCYTATGLEGIWFSRLPDRPVGEA